VFSALFADTNTAQRSACRGMKSLSTPLVKRVILSVMGFSCLPVTTRFLKGSSLHTEQQIRRDTLNSPVVGERSMRLKLPDNNNFSRASTRVSQRLVNLSFATCTAAAYGRFSVRGISVEGTETSFRTVFSNGLKISMCDEVVLCVKEGAVSPKPYSVVWLWFRLQLVLRRRDNIVIVSRL